MPGWLADSKHKEAADSCKYLGTCGPISTPMGQPALVSIFEPSGHGQTVILLTRALRIRQGWWLFSSGPRSVQTKA